MATGMGCAYRCDSTLCLCVYTLELNSFVPSAIIGLQGFLPLKGSAAVGVGAIEYPTTERKRLAALWVTSLHLHRRVLIVF